ncbi:MAG: hypothetical protein ACNS61_04450 [Candidatus Wenzhouxiangella sp. M2_3B_020]
MSVIPRATSLGAAMALSISGPIWAQDESPAGLAGEEANPTVAENQTWISLSGTVTSTSSDSFRMDYGDGLITVVMGEWGNWADEFPLTDGDDVTVRGEVDENLYVNDAIEAASIYVEDLNSFFFARPDERADMGVWAADPVVTVGQVDYTGTVQSVDPMTDSFTIDTGKQELTVDVDALLYDPLDDEGFQKIEIGDLVQVRGNLTEDFFANNDLVAESIVTLEDDEGIVTVDD